VQRGAPGTYVYLVNADSTVSVHPITLGAQDGDFFAVNSGLSPGDRVVTDGADRLRDGAKVSIPANTPAPPSGSDAAKGAPAANGDKSARGQHRHRPQQPGTSPPSSASPQQN
jgi:multidrug efflux system membrane fusion protein